MRLRTTPAQHRPPSIVLRARLARMNAAGALFDLAAMNGAPTSLRQIGMSESDLDKAADAALQSAYWNPRPIERDPIRALLDDAYHGRRPS